MVSSTTIRPAVFTALLSMVMILCPAHSFVVQPMLTTRSTSAAAIATKSSFFTSVSADVINRGKRCTTSTKPATSFCLSATSDATEHSTSTNTLTLTLDKPLGLILEEVDTTSSIAGGVIVSQVNENGSAYTSPYRDSLPQMKIKTVMGKDVSILTLEDVMDVIINAPSPVIIEFVSLDSAIATSLEMNATTSSPVPTLPKYAMGTPVTIIVQQPSETRKPEITIEAKVGDNLRKTLLSNPDIELYRGLKKKLGNCGGGGQCGFCAVEVIDTDEEGQVWGKRSDYEGTKIGKNGNEKTRLACLNNIVGPATVRTL